MRKVDESDSGSESFTFDKLRFSRDVDFSGVPFEARAERDEIDD